MYSLNIVSEKFDKKINEEFEDDWGVYLDRLPDHEMSKQLIKLKFNSKGITYFTPYDVAAAHCKKNPQDRGKFLTHGKIFANSAEDFGMSVAIRYNEVTSVEDGELDWTINYKQVVSNYFSVYYIGGTFKVDEAFYNDKDMKKATYTYYLRDRFGNRFKLSTNKGGSTYNIDKVKSITADNLNFKGMVRDRYSNLKIPLFNSSKRGSKVISNM